MGDGIPNFRERAFAESGDLPMPGLFHSPALPQPAKRREMGGETPKGLSVKRQGQSRTLAINSWATGELRVAVSYPRAIEKRTALSAPLPLPKVNPDKGAERNSQGWETK